MVLLAIIQTLNFTGFCYSEFRYLSDKELIDRYLFGNQGLKLTFEAKQKKLKEENDGKYPECCRVDNDPWWIKRLDKILFSFFGFSYYELYTVLPQKGSDAPFYEQYILANSCGSKFADEYGMSISEEEYASQLKYNFKQWKVIEK